MVKFKLYKPLFLLALISIITLNQAQVDKDVIIDLAQNGTVKAKYKKASSLMKQERYEFAVEIWKLLIKDTPDNASFNYQAGYCCLQVPKLKNDALSYFKVAGNQISIGADINSFEEVSAPVETYYFLGLTYHLNMELSNSLEKFSEFLDEVGLDHRYSRDASLHKRQLTNAAILIKKKSDKIVIKNLGSKVNGESADYAPVITSDGSTMFFTSKRIRKDGSNKSEISGGDGDHFEDVYTTSMNRKTKTWGYPELMNFSSPTSNQASTSASPDGQFLFIYKDDAGNGDLYVAEREGFDYGEPKKMSDNINTKAWEFHATVSSDGSTLLFVSDRLGGLGGRDIYSCRRLPNGEWSLPLNLGAPINTEYDEASPFLDPNGKILYFSSNGNESMGGYDILKSSLKADGKWDVPVNMGYPINSVSNDVSYSTTANGKNSYFSSERVGDGLGEKDIYEVVSTEITDPGVTILKGYIDKGVLGKLPEDVYIMVTDLTTGSKYEYVPNPKSGAYVFSLTPCHEYDVKYMNGDKPFGETTFVNPCGSNYNEIRKVIMLKEWSLDGNKEPAPEK